MFKQGEAIRPIQLSASGGQPPYSFSAVGLPAGLAIATDQIQGTPTSVGSGTATITVTDNLLNTANSQFNWAVGTPAAVTHHYTQRAKNQARIIIKAESRILVPSEVAVNLTLPAITMSASVLDATRTVEAVINLPAITMTATARITDVDAAAYIARLTGTYSGAEEAAIVQFFIDLKTAGLYTGIDAMYLHAADNVTDGLLNMVSTSFTASRQNMMTHTARQGFTGNGSDMYLNTTFTPSTAGGNFTQNSATLGVYSRTNSIESNGVDIGGFTTGVGGSYILSRFNNTNSSYFFRVNQLSGDNSTINNSSLGMLTASRTGASAVAAYRNGVSIDTSGTASGSLLDQSIYIGCWNFDGSPIDLSTRQYAFSVIAAGWNATQNTDFYNAVQSLMTAFGANV